MGIALVQFAPAANWAFVAIVFIVFLIGQFLEGNVLYPRFVGQSININPVWLMFALFAFAFLFGFVGLLLAVPLAAITATLTRYALRRYKESALYAGDRPPKPVAAAQVSVVPELPDEPAARWRWPRQPRQAGVRRGRARRLQPSAGRQMISAPAAGQLPFDWEHSPRTSIPTSLKGTETALRLPTSAPSHIGRTL